MFLFAAAASSVDVSLLTQLDAVRLTTALCLFGDIIFSHHIQSAVVCTLAAVSLVPITIIIGDNDSCLN